MNNEGERGIGPNLTLFFGRFLNTPDGMAAYLGFNATQ